MLPSAVINELIINCTQQVLLDELIVVIEQLRNLPVITTHARIKPANIKAAYPDPTVTVVSDSDLECRQPFC
jgi:hypothetical protein